jgi:ankyrin repeat protein
VICRSTPEPPQKKLITALRGRDLVMARRIAQTSPAAVRHASGICEAARLGWFEAVKLLVRHGADLNAEYRKYRPLHNLIQEKPHAVPGSTSRKRLQCLAWMLKQGADPELLGAWPPARAILVAAFSGEPAYVDVLRKAGARVDGLVCAALGDLRGVQAALKRDQGLATARDAGGLTALQCCCASRLGAKKPAVARSLLAIAKLLIARGADVRATTRSWAHDVDAVYFACNSGQVETFNLLIENGADATEALAPALWQPHTKLAEIALAHGAQINRADDDNRPLLNNLIRWGQFRQASWLLEHGADPNRPAPDGWTAMHQAASRGNERMMRALLAAGGDPLRKDAKGYTAASIALLARRSKILALFA